jgi:hypothetical protein
MINRSVVMVRPKQPFLDWVAGLDDSGLLPEVDGETTVYLMPNFDTHEDAWEMIEEIYPAVFENELWGWHTDEAEWPKDRDFATFQEWFAIEVHSVVEDLCDYEILDEDQG